MHHAIQAYSRNQSLSLSQRELEAAALMKAAAKMQQLKDNWEPTLARIEDPLSHNREVWTLFLASACDPECALPADLRANVIGLGRFVINSCMRMLFEPDLSKLDLLIEINQNIAAGLRSSNTAQERQPAPAA